MRIHHMGASLTAARHLMNANESLSRNLRSLSSGLRINSAADDPAGLAIAERMRARIGSMRRAIQNTQDGISITQVMDGAMDEVSVMLRRGLELAIQAGNGSYGPEETRSLQGELDDLIQEIARIGTATTFNGRRLFQASDARALDAVEGLRKSWLQNAEQLVVSAYGLTPGSTVGLKIVLDDTASNPAFVRGTVGAGGRYNNLELHLNLSAFDNFDLPNGGSGFFHVDRVIAHEMTHAIMSQTMNFAALPQWFKEGAAEFVAGADDRLAIDLANAGGTAGLVAELNSWTGSSPDYSAGYAAVKYLHSQIIAAGNATGMRALMGALSGGATLDAAINSLTGGAYADMNAFVSDFQSASGGQAFISSLNLADADVGGIMPGDAVTVVPDTVNDTWDPLTHFAEVWPTGMTGFQPIGPIQVGTEAGETIALPQISLDLFGLGLGGLDLTTDAAGAIEKLYRAVDQVSTSRAQIGAVANRLEHAINVGQNTVEALTASESRIRDLDMAKGMADFTRDQIRQQAATAMLAQANKVHRQAILSLLGQ